MPRPRPSYAAEFREQIVALHRAGRTPAELAREFEPTEQTIRNWIAQASEPGGAALSASEREELRGLRREVKQLRLEREILSKAAAWFARETDALPKRSSRS